LGNKANSDWTKIMFMADIRLGISWELYVTMMSHK